MSGAACDGFMQRGASAPPQGRAATCLRISLLPIDLPEEAGKLGREGSVEHGCSRGAKDVADCDQDDILDVFGFVRQPEWTRPAGGQHCRSFHPARGIGLQCLASVGWRVGPASHESPGELKLYRSHYCVSSAALGRHGLAAAGWRSAPALAHGTSLLRYTA